MKEKESDPRSDEYHLDETGPEMIDQIIAQERSDYIKRRTKALALAIAILFAFLMGPRPVLAGGPKCDRNDSARCGMKTKSCAGMDGAKRTGSSCSNICHKGCCSCPDTDEPDQQSCPRDKPMGNPDEEGNPQ